MTGGGLEKISSDPQNHECQHVRQAPPPLCKDLEQPDPALLDEVDDDESMADEEVEIVAALALLDMSVEEKYFFFLISLF